MTEGPGKGARILVVEDDAINRTVLARQLAMVGVDAEMACNGVEGLERWRLGRYGLVLSDLHMPVMDGFGMVRAIRGEEPPGRHTAVLAFSADVRLGQAEKVRDAGFDAFLSKPIQLEGLRAVLDKWMPAASPDDDDGPVAAAAPAPAPAAASFDVATLGEIVGEEPALMLEILAYFDETSAAMRTELLGAVAAGNAVEAGMLAHRLKASAQAVGAKPLGAACARLEQYVDGGGGREGLAPLVDAIMEALDAALVAMRHWRAAQGRETVMTRYPQ